jgi:hypothetical protein
VIIGTCSLCGGRVSTPGIWMGVVPPTPTCESCGAVKADHGPVIDMKPAPRRQRARTTTTTGTGVDFCPDLDDVMSFDEWRRWGRR